jgi:hypothetical protein
LATLFRDKIFKNLCVGIPALIRTWEYPTNTRTELGHRELNEFTWFATAATPCWTELAYEAPPHDAWPPHAG